MAAISRAWGYVLAWGPEASLAILVHQGSYQTLSIAGIRVSYYMFAACVLLVALAYHRYVMAPGPPGLPKGVYLALLPMGLFAGFYLASSSWSPAVLFGAQRAIKAIFVAALAVLAGRLIVAQPERLTRLVCSVLAIGVFFLVAGLTACTLSGWEHSLPSVFGVRAGIQGKSIGLAWVCTLGLLFAARGEDSRSLRKALALAVLLAAITYGVLACGSRGLVATLGALGAGVVAFGLARAELRAHSGVVCASAALGALLFAGTVPSNSRTMRLYRNLFRAFSGASVGQAVEVAQSRDPLQIAGSTIEDEYRDRFQIAAVEPEAVELFGKTRRRNARMAYGRQGEGLEADLSLRERFGLAHAAWTLFRAHWLFGTGAGGYSAATQWRLAHNAVLEVMAETGVVGLVLLIAWATQILLLPSRVSRARSATIVWGAWNTVWLVLIFSAVSAQFGTLFDENRLPFLLTPILLLARLPKRVL